jgi:glycerate-2-kinase
VQEPVVVRTVAFGQDGVDGAGGAAGEKVQQRILRLVVSCGS